MDGVQYQCTNNQLYSSEHTEVSEGKIQPHEMLTLSPAMIFNQ